MFHFFQLYFLREHARVWYAHECVCVCGVAFHLGKFTLFKSLILGLELQISQNPFNWSFLSKLHVLVGLTAVFRLKKWFENLTFCATMRVCRFSFRYEAYWAAIWDNHWIFHITRSDENSQNLIIWRCIVKYLAGHSAILAQKVWSSNSCWKK